MEGEGLRLRGTGFKRRRRGGAGSIAGGYVCGCVLRCAREFFAFLPLQRVIVNVKATLLASATGHFLPKTILSAGIARWTLEGMNFVAVDLSESLKLFPHRMGFKRSQGFYPVQALLSDEYPKIA
jgi:hypothetical protein